MPPIAILVGMLVTTFGHSSPDAARALASAHEQSTACWHRARSVEYVPADVLKNAVAPFESRDGLLLLEHTDTLTGTATRPFLITEWISDGEGVIVLEESFAWSLGPKEGVANQERWSDLGRAIRMRGRDSQVQWTDASDHFLTPDEQHELIADGVVPYDMLRAVRGHPLLLLNYVLRSLDASPDTSTGAVNGELFDEPTLEVRSKRLGVALLVHQETGELIGAAVPTPGQPEVETRMLLLGPASQACGMPRESRTWESKTGTPWQLDDDFRSGTVRVFDRVSGVDPLTESDLGWSSLGSTAYDLRRGETVRADTPITPPPAAPRVAITLPSPISSDTHMLGDSSPWRLARWGGGALLVAGSGVLVWRRMRAG